MKKLFVALLLGGSLLANAQQLPYRNPNLPADERTADLIQRMTLPEKVGQLLCPLGWEMYTIQGQEVVPSDKFKKLIGECGAGMLWATFRADPWTRKTLADGLNPKLAAQASNALQRYVMENTRLGIPIFLAEEAPHGHMAIGTTVFPTGIGMAATWNPALIEETGQVIGEEVRLQGGHISYGPVLDLARDARWSRVEETFGECPVLSATIGTAMVRGLGGGDLSRPYSTIATLKHFLAYAVPEGGQNGNFSQVGERDLRDFFLPPFQKAVEAGALSIMSSYNSIDGIPCTANSYLFNDLLKQQWGFRGFSVSDLYSIDGIHEAHHVAPTLTDAAAMAVNAGIDIDLGGKAYRKLIEAVENGKVKTEVVDAAVARVLRLKFEMGLFDHPYVDVPTAARKVRDARKVATARRMAQASVTLLKNDRHLLPLSKTVGRVAVIGPNADNGYNMLGDYTAPQADNNITTVLEGIRHKLADRQVEYVKGCAIRDTLQSNIEAAVAAAQRADVVVAVVGGSSARDFKTSYKETGAAIADTRNLSDMECGEGYDRASLHLLGHQDKLLRALKTTGKPLVVVYIEGRPLDKLWASENADALLTAYYPGQEGGTAVADVLFGDYNPAGRLPFSVPRSVGQVPVYYNKKAPANHDYVEMSAQPLYAFGYGLSYTRFDYSDLQIERKGEQSCEVSFTVTNTGDRAGEEVAQLYLRDVYASVAQPLMQLKRFERFHLEKGKSRRIRFTLQADDFAFTNRDYRRVVEPGDFQLMIGAASNDIRLKGLFQL